MPANSKPIDNSTIAFAPEGFLQSDIDIAIMFQEKYESKREVIIKGNIIDMGMKYFQRKLDVVSLNSATPLLKYEVVRKGILLKESKRRAEFESLALREYFDFRYYAEAYNKAMIEAIKKDLAQKAGDISGKPRDINDKIK
ncbi:nucleotidyltransferase domain-containing protein [Alkaliphilus peptidifermentans]|nr:nucleotidyltransferase domain-containing protein [Alkaliphilus peptidifermentans]